jgi:hypothetical protein
MIVPLPQKNHALSLFCHALPDACALLSADANVGVDAVLVIWVAIVEATAVMQAATFPGLDLPRQVTISGAIVINLPQKLETT